MGAQTAQVQSPQSSQPAGKGAGESASSERKTISLSGLSGQPGLGKPNTNGNTDLAPVNPTFVAQTGSEANTNPYTNTVGQISNQSTQTPAGKGKGA
jgi:hypothetical protein